MSSTTEGKRRSIFPRHRRYALRILSWGCSTDGGERLVHDTGSGAIRGSKCSSGSLSHPLRPDASGQVGEAAEAGYGNLTMVEITRLPPGEALGARDLQGWAHQRSAGRAGVNTTREEWKRLKQWKPKPKFDAADRWLARHAPKREGQ